MTSMVVVILPWTGGGVMENLSLADGLHGEVNSLMDLPLNVGIIMQLPLIP